MTNPTARAISPPSEAELLALLPSDLGGLTVLEHLQRMAEDAARYEVLWRAVSADETFQFRGVLIDDGSVLDEVVDAARK